MKKYFIAAFLLVSTGLTALSITREDKTPEAPVEKITVAEQAESITTVNTLATAD